MRLYDRRSRTPSVLAAVGAVLAAIAIGLSAYASHGVSDAQAQQHLQTASLYALVHGVALAALGARSDRLLAGLALTALLLGTLMFSGSLVVGALLHWSTRLAPVGGVTMMVGWVLFAVHSLRR